MTSHKGRIRFRSNFRLGYIANGERWNVAFDGANEPRRISTYSVKARGVGISQKNNLISYKIFSLFTFARSPPVARSVPAAIEPHEVYRLIQYRRRGIGGGREPMPISHGWDRVGAFGGARFGRDIRLFVKVVSRTDVGAS